MIKNILFDFDGTLVDTSEGIIKSMHHAFDRLGKERISDESIALTIGAPLEDMFAMLIPGISPEDIVRAVHFFRERYSVKGVNERVIYPKVVDTLKELGKSKKLYIVSSKPEIFIKQICEEYDVLDCFAGLTGVTKEGASASKADRMRLLMDTLGMDSNETIMVGDRPEDAYAAGSNNVECIGMLYGFSNEKDLTTAGCKVLYKSFDELLTYNFQ